MTDYAIRGGVEGKRRLDLLAQVMAPTTEALLAEVGVGAGLQCFDVGCGGGHVSALLARLVGDSGSVVGIDFDEVKLESARADCRGRGLRVEFRQANVAEWQEADLGPHLYGLCLDAGLDDVSVRVVQPTHGGRDPLKELSLSTLVNISDAVVAERLASRDEREITIAALARFTEDPRSLIGLPRIVQVWGRHAHRAA
jgi:SAM-dependent methyltransferase